jgi:cytochrome-b5 reductase
MLQVIKEILKNPNDKTQIHLIFANNSEKDILLKDMLDNLEKNHGTYSS